MNFKKGDKVRFLNEKGEGVVCGIVNNTTIKVSVDGFEIPFQNTELILITDEKVSPVSTKEEKVEQKHHISRQPEVLKTEPKEGIYIAISPEREDDIQNTGMNVWLINNTEYETLFSFSLLRSEKAITIHTGKTEAWESVLIETIAKGDIDKLSNFKVDILFFDLKEHVHRFPMSEIKKLKIVKLYKKDAFEYNDLIDAIAYVIPVSDTTDYGEQLEATLASTNFSAVLTQKRGVEASQKMSKPHANNNPENEMEIDIHIEELLENYSNLSNGEILKIQLNHFQSALDNAIYERYRKLIVIHGVGKLLLKQEVRKILSTYNNVKVYDASYAKYGFGATEIIINH